MTKTKETKVKNTKEKSDFSLLSLMQNIGKSLVYPIATLPAAALLLRIGAFISSYGQIGEAATAGEQFAYWIGFIMVTPGAAVFDNLPIIFGIGVAFGFAKENRGEVALVGAIAYFALIGLAQGEGSLSTLFYSSVNLGGGAYTSGNVFHSDLLYLNIVNKSGEMITSTWLMNFGVFGGILTGLITAQIYNKFSTVRLHPALGFFSGRRFVPIITLFLMIDLAFIMAIIWPWINIALIKMSIAISFIPFVGAGIYGFTNRLLIPFGLHQVLNTYFWFQSPVITGAAEAGIAQGAQVMVLNAKGIFEPLLGDITAFSKVIDGTVFSFGNLDGNGATISYMLHVVDVGEGSFLEIGNVVGDKFIGTGKEFAGGIDILRGTNIGMYQAGFFPTMMFGLPAVAGAMALKADNEHKKPVYAFMIAGSVVAFLTGITEPLEFSFMFISPVIYVVYAALTGVYAMIVVGLGISVGFGFSAGLIDWVLSILSGGVGTLSKSGNFANLYLLLIGIGAAALNFTIIYTLIGTLNIATPGRNGNVAGLTIGDDENEASQKSGPKSSNNKLVKMAEDTINFIGKENIKGIDNCITRVRLIVKDNSIYSDKEAIKIGYGGVIKVGKKAYQLIIGPDAEVIANEMRRLISEGFGEENQVSINKKPSAEKLTEKTPTKKITNKLTKHQKQLSDIAAAVNRPANNKERYQDKEGAIKKPILTNFKSSDMTVGNNSTKKPTTTPKVTKKSTTKTTTKVTKKPTTKSTKK